MREKEKPMSVADFKLKIAGIMRNQSADEAALSAEGRGANSAIVRGPEDRGYNPPKESK